MDQHDKMPSKSFTYTNPTDQSDFPFTCISIDYYHMFIHNKGIYYIIQVDRLLTDNSISISSTETSKSNDSKDTKLLKLF